jgi:hypothetical protein
MNGRQPHRFAVCLAAVVLAMACIGLPQSSAAAPESLKPTDCLYLPPSWADRVGFYHTFESQLDRPEINRVGAKLTQPAGELGPGFAGRGCRLPLGSAKNVPFEISCPAISVHRPITLMFWFRLDKPMTETSGFGLLTLRGNGPYISHFVAGKGPWCGLQEPTFISQVVAFPGIPQYHNSWGGRAWFDEGQWHHMAMTVANGAEIRIYRDGKLIETILPKGRLFKDGEVTTAAIGSRGHPMTVDEVILLDRVLTGSEIAQYVTSARSLKERAFPVFQTAGER